MKTAHFSRSIPDYDIRIEFALFVALIFHFTAFKIEQKR